MLLSKSVRLTVGKGLVLAGLIAVGTSDAAADPDWTGFYVGAFAGAVWGEPHLRTDTGPVVPGGTYFQSQANASAVSSDASGSSSSEAFTGGALIGASQRIDQTVIGAEIDYGSFSLNGSRGASGVYPDFPVAYTVASNVGTDWLFTARGRFGWLATPHAQLYVTGGLALTDITVSNSFSDVAPSRGSGSSSSSTTKAGWTVGGGLEWAAMGPWSIKAEYLYVDFGSASTSTKIVCTGIAGVCPPGVNSLFSTSADLSASIVRLGVNYSLGN